MSISIYEISIPVLLRGLENLSALIDKGVASAEAHKYEPAVLLQARLFPNMFALTRQVQIACDMAKGCAARLAGLTAPKFEDNETTIAEVQARIAKTRDYVASITPAQLEGAETRDIVISFPGTTMNFKGLNFVTDWVLPNFYFHVTTTYALLRHNGVDVGKGDFLGKVQ